MSIEQKKRSGFQIFALVLGILSLVFSFFYLISEVIYFVHFHFLNGRNIYTFIQVFLMEIIGALPIIFIIMSSLRKKGESFLHQVPVGISLIVTSCFSFLFMIINIIVDALMKNPYTFRLPYLLSNFSPLVTLILIISLAIIFFVANKNGKLSTGLQVFFWIVISLLVLYELFSLGRFLLTYRYTVRNIYGLLYYLQNILFGYIKSLFLPAIEILFFVDYLKYKKK